MLEHLEFFGVEGARKQLDEVLGNVISSAALGSEDRPAAQGFFRRAAETLFGIVLLLEHADKGAGSAEVAYDTVTTLIEKISS